MGDDFSRDDPNVGPDHLPGPDFGGSITFDSDGHVRSVDIDVPGTAEGSDPAHIDFGGGDPSSPPGVGWMPHVSDPNSPNFDPLSVPPPPGWHRDPITGVEYPDLNLPPAGDGGGSDAGSMGPGDFPTPDPDESVG